MTNLDDLVRRQAAILAEIDGLGTEELESFANSPLPEDPVSGEIKKARKLLRGLVRTWNVGSGDLTITWPGTDNPGTVASPPGFFVIDLQPLPEGGFDRGQVMKTPVVAWEIDSGGEAKPVIPGPPMGDRWAVLTPTGLVIVDEWARLDYGLQITLKDWIESEIEWVESAATSDFRTASQNAFEYRGPLPRAIWFMMAGRRDWKGAPEEMLEALSKFRDHSYATDWPSDSVSLAETLEELQAVLASVGLLAARIDDGRLLITRVGDDGTNRHGIA